MTTNDEVRFLAALLTMRPGETMADRLTQYLKPPAWHSGACAGLGPGAFYPEAKGSTPAPGLEVCRRCPVVDACAAAGDDEDHGTWGGRSERERRVVRSSGRLPRPVSGEVA